MVRIRSSPVSCLAVSGLGVAVNFDKEREEPPLATKFTKAAMEAKTLGADEIVIHKTPQAAEYCGSFCKHDGLAGKLRLAGKWISDGGKCLGAAQAFSLRLFAKPPGWPGPARGFDKPEAET